MGPGGCVGIVGKQVSVMVHLARQRVTLRIDAKLIQVIMTTNCVLARTLPTGRGRLHRARLSGPAPGSAPDKSSPPNADLVRA